SSNRTIATRNVVPTRVNEEEPEVSAPRHRLRHHRDQQTAMAARLEAEPGPEIVVVFLEEAALRADRGAREPPEAAREQTHPDSSGVKVDGRDHAIRAHGHLNNNFKRSEES